MDRFNDLFAGIVTTVMLSTLTVPITCGQWIAGSNPATMLAGSTAAIVGTAGPANATLRVRGDQLPVQDQFISSSVCTFRTDVTSGNSQNWSMVSGALEIGRLFHFNPNNSFQIQARQRNGALWLRNAEAPNGNGGFRLAFDGNGSGGTFTVNTFVLNPIGWAQLGAVTGINTVNPYARFALMHENMGTVPTQCYRPWFDNALLGMGNSDMYYIGHKYAMTGGTGAEQDENSTVVAAWGDPSLPAGLGHQFDTFQFRYLAALDATSSAGSIDGLELMRLRPFRLAAGDPVQGFVGIGDWSAANTGPEERLDVLDRTIRVRSFMGTYTPSFERPLLDHVVVADPTDGRLYWRTLPTGGGGSNCTWELNNGNVATAYAPDGTNNICPEVDNNVGIGVPFPVSAKLHVSRVATTAGDHGGILSTLTAPGTTTGTSGNESSAITGNLTGSGFRLRGVYGTAVDDGAPSQYLMGVEGSAYSPNGAMRRPSACMAMLAAPAWHMA